MIGEIFYNRYPHSGYPVDRMNCVDNPIAHCSGIFNYDNYYYYSFIFSLSRLWGIPSEDKAFPQRVINILNVLGLTLRCNETDTLDEAIRIIKKKIDENKPPIIYTTYSTLFYSDFYNSNDAASFMNHAISVFKYNSEKSLISIREQGHHFLDTTDEFRSSLNIHLTLPEETFQQLIKKRKSPNGLEKFLVYSIEEISTDKSFSTYEDMLNYFINNYSINNNQLVNRILQFGSTNVIDSQLMSELNIIIHASHLFFDGIKKVTTFMNAVKMDDYIKMEKTYKNTIQTVVNILRKCIVKREKLPNEKLETLVSKIYEIDHQLLHFVKGNYNVLEDNTNEENFTFSGYYRILNTYSGKYLQSTSCDDLDNIIQYEETNDDSQVWRFIPTDNGYFNIVNKFSNKTLDVLFTSIEEGAPVGQYSISGHWCQQWELDRDPIDKSKVKIRNRGSAKLLSIFDDSKVNFAEIIQASENLTLSSEWRILKF